MVVQHNGFFPLLFYRLNLMDCPNAVINRDKQFCTQFELLIYRLQGNPIPLLNTVGQSDYYLGAEPSQCQVQYGGPCDAVGVVIPKNANLFPTVYVVPYEVGNGIYITDFRWVMHRCRVQKHFRIRFRCNTGFPHDNSRERRIAGFHKLLCADGHIRFFPHDEFLLI